MAGLCELAISLRASELGFPGAKSPIVSGGFLKYSRFRETGAGDRVLSAMRSRVCSEMAKFLCRDAEENRECRGRLPRLPAVEAACAEAIAHGVHSADVVLNILARQRDPGPPATILTPAALTLRHAPIADCARYDNLRNRTDDANWPVRMIAIITIAACADGLPIFRQTSSGRYIVSAGRRRRPPSVAPIPDA